MLGRVILYFQAHNASLNLPSLLQPIRKGGAACTCANELNCTVHLLEQKAHTEGGVALVSLVPNEGICYFKGEQVTGVVPARYVQQPTVA